MPRVASVWLKNWSIERFLKAQSRAYGGASPDGIVPGRPFALVDLASGKPLIAEANEAAKVLGVCRGDVLADVRAQLPDIQTRIAEPEKDAEGIAKLALWCALYTPWTAAAPAEEGGDGIALDITGCAHLFGGEFGLLSDLVSRLKRTGLTARAAVANSYGAAWAVARFGREDISIVESGREANVLRDLPIAALRLPFRVVETLSRLGFNRSGEVLNQPRAPFVARFGDIFARRIDQALGIEPEPLSPQAPPPSYRVRVVLAEPIRDEHQILFVIEKLARDLQALLERDGKGAKTIELALYRIDGVVERLQTGLAQPSRDPVHLVKLFALRLSRLTDELDVGFGFEAGSLDVIEADEIAPPQAHLDNGDAMRREETFSALIDRLGSRLGLEKVRNLFPYQSHLPERAVVSRAALHHPSESWAIEGTEPNRPLLMLPCAEPADVMAQVPEGPPRQFRWRGVRYEVARALGPERVEPEWWMKRADRTRDYYIVEDGEGRRFWIYRAGLYGADIAPRWFVHGVFA